MNEGFSYHIEDDKIKGYMKLTVEDKLKWLHEINAFNRLCLTDLDRKVMHILRSE